MKYLAFIVIILGLLSCNRSEKFQSTVTNTIYDSAKILTPQQTDSIFSVIKELKSTIGSEMVVIIIDYLNGQEINDYSIHHAERLNIGRESHKDGILLLVSLKDRKVRIEVGFGLEQIIKDEIASRLIREVIIPRFKEEKYGLGIYLGLDSIKNLIISNKNLVGKSV